ncbi:hypothetical protein XELAEV_18039035mg [Xenopus laevis]|uniref:Secreted protein n=1 Tax=Xenopus laevis TaxID=8355 RepID=A0A974C6X8_XENLA|nr:hypothetical protein XELAEV_18039035mg [Xenopus laevis]
MLCTLPLHLFLPSDCSSSAVLCCEISYLQFKSVKDIFRDDGESKSTRRTSNLWSIMPFSAPKGTVSLVWVTKYPKLHFHQD